MMDIDNITNNMADNITADSVADFVQAVSNGNISDLQIDYQSNIMVIGVGGAGGNAVNHMQTLDIVGVNFVVCNTDAQALNNCCIHNKIQMGPGLGAGNDPAKGRMYAIESEEQLRSLLETSKVKMLFIAAGMGGGTGTGASPIIAKIAHDLGILTVAVVTMPLRIEGPTRYQNAVNGLTELHPWVDSLLVIDNERVRAMYGKLPLSEAFGKADNVLGMATKGIAELITVEFALVRVDFADVSKVMRKSGRAHISVVKGSGERRALEAAESALASSLLDDNQITGAKEILLSFAVNDIDKLAHDEIVDTIECIQKHASYTDEDGVLNQADIIWGASEKRSLEDDELELVVVATRFADGDQLKIKPNIVDPIYDNPFEVPSKPQEVVVKPQPERPVIVPPKEPVTISPQQDRYKSQISQTREPGYVRRGARFDDETEVVPTTIFQPVTQSYQDDDAVMDNGSLF
ncbi:MAG: cell division FtsZ family protein [Alistipes sp.]|nr:cell division FtsZ family protein [Alistipes sp.]